MRTAILKAVALILVAASLSGGIAWAADLGLIGAWLVGLALGVPAGVLGTRLITASADEGLDRLV